MQRRYNRPEGNLSVAIADYLTAKGIYNDRLNAGKIAALNARTGRSYFVHLCRTGTPDRFLIYKGRIMFIEVKTTKTKPTVNQICRHDELRRAGAVVAVARTFEEFLAHFSQFKKDIDDLRAAG